MSRLEELSQKILSLPDIQSERDRISITERVKDNAKIVAQGLIVNKRQAHHIDTLTRGKMATYTNDVIGFTIQQGKSLKKMIRRDKFGSEQKISELLDNLSKKMDWLENQKNQTWMTVQRETQTVERILEIAKTLNLESVSTLTVAISNFKTATVLPPSSISEVQRVVDARKANESAIKNSGLSGNVQKILEGAIKQNGDPKLLLEVDVLKFFTDHPALWESLKLRLA